MGRVVLMLQGNQRFLRNQKKPQRLTMMLRYRWNLKALDTKLAMQMLGMAGMMDLLTYGLPRRAKHITHRCPGTPNVY